MRILSWNICALPSYLNLYHNPENIIDNTIYVLNDYNNVDFICLQECFDKSVRLKLFKNFEDYNILYENSGGKIKINSGLVILTKHRIIDSGFIRYKHSCGEDRLANKGFMYATFKKNGKDYVVYNTHLNNDEPLFNLFTNSLQVIEQQLFQLLRHAYNKVKNGYQAILSGDFNSSPYTILYCLSKCVFKNSVKLYNFTKATERTDMFGENIDHILIMKDEDDEYIETSIEKIENTICSDHKIVLCSFNNTNNTINTNNSNT